MRNLNVKVLTLLSSLLIIGATFVSAAGSIDPISRSNMKSDEQIILVEMEGLRNEGLLSGLDLSVIHDYGEFALVKTNGKLAHGLKSRGVEVNILPARTEISVKEHTFDFTEEEPEIASDLSIEEYEPGKEGLYIVHMLGPVSPDWREELENKGVEVINYIPNYAYEVSMTPETAVEVEDLSFVDWVGIYHPAYKFDPQLEPDKVNVKFNPELSTDDVMSIASKLPVSDHQELDRFEHGLTLNITSKAELRNLARMKEVYYISQYREPELHSEIESQIIGGGAWIMDDEQDDIGSPYRKYGDFGAYINQLGYTGENVTIAVGDTGIGNGTIGDAGHPDLTGRVIGGHGFEDLDDDDWSDSHGHGTHTTGSAAGNTYQGSGEKGEYPGFGPYYMAQGLASESKIYAAKIFDPGWVDPDYYDIIEVPKQEADAYVHTNSWGATTAGEYTASDEIFDQAVRDADRNTTGNQPMVITVSAGNSGAQEQTIGSPGNAKNVITIGATESYVPDGSDYGGGDTENPASVSRFSSRGWTQDNRVKPDVVAPGENVLSLDHPAYSKGATYEWMSGTSMSTPAVAGAASVVVEWYDENFGEKPSPAMVRSLLINTAHDLDSGGCETGPIPNKDEGWGMVDISKLEYPKDDPVPFMLEDQKTSLETGDVEEYEVKREREGEPLKITLGWTDKNALSGDNRTLKNDLDLEVKAPDGSVYNGNAFDQGWTRPDAPAMEDFDPNGDGRDDTNNVENVYIPSEEVEDGTYTVRVIGTNVPADANNDSRPNQDYALAVYNAAVPSAEIISPEEGEIIRGSNVKLKWISKRSQYHEVRLGQEDWIDVGENDSYTFEGLDDGEYTAEIKAVGDKKSVKNSVTFTVKTDPHIRIESPAEGEIVRESDVEAAWTSYNVTGHEIRLNDKDWIDVGGDTSYVFEGVEDGDHILDVRSTSETVTESVNFSVDTSPYLNITFPEDKEVTGEGELEVRWISYNIEGHEIRLNDKDWIDVGNETDHVFEEMNGGEHRIEVRSIDDDVTESIDFSFYLERDPIHITGNEELEEMAGQEGWPGTGEEEDPYVIEWYDLSGKEESSALTFEEVSDHFIVKNNKLHDANRSGDASSGNSGVVLNGTENGRLANNKVSFNSYGIHLKESTENVIVDNKMVNNHVGIYVSSSIGNKIEGNHVKKSHYPVYGRGIWLEKSDGNELMENSVSNHDRGIVLSSSPENHLSENNASYNGKGVELRESEKNSVEKTELFTNDIGIYVYKSTDNTLSGTQSFNDNYGIYLTHSEKNRLYDNVINHSRWYGMRIGRSNDNEIEGNRIVSSDSYGIYLFSSESNSFEDNELIDDSLHFWGRSVEHWNTHSIDESNTVNGKPIIYRKDVSGETITEDASQIILANCTDMVVKDQKIEDGDIGILLGFSDNNRIVENTVTQQMQSITLRYSNRNVLESNTLYNSTTGYYMVNSDRNVIAENHIYNNSWPGVYMSSSKKNIVFGNNISNNHVYGVYLTRSKPNHIYHNELYSDEIGDAEIEGQAYDNKNNSWDDGEEGNYWSDYKDRYPGSHEVGDSGIWNRSYGIPGNESEDRYPLVKRDPVEEFRTHIVQPSEQETVYSSEVTASWASKGEEGEIDYEIRLNEEEWIDVDDERTHTFEDLQKGEHTVKVRGEDDAGIGSRHSVDFQVDPGINVEITSPENGSTERRSSVDIEWLVENAEDVEIKLDGPGDEEGKWIEPDEEGEHRYDDLEDGDYEVQVRAEDDNGNSDSDSIEFSVKTVKIEIISPEEDQVIRSDNFTVKWTSENADFHEIRVCDRHWENVGGAKEFKLTDLQDGEYEISVRAWDKTGWRETDTVTVTVDATSPPVRIVSPDDGSIFSTDEVTVRWVFENIERNVELKHYEIKVDEEWINIGDSTEYVLEGLEDGEYTVEVKAVDKSERVGKESVTFLIDTASPQITITSPSGGTELSDRFVTVEWQGEAEPSGIEYYEIRLDQGEWILAGENTEYTFAGLSAGDHTVEVRAWDRAGNSKIVSLNFEIRRFDIPYYLVFAGVVIAIVIARLGVEAWRKRGEEEKERRMTLPELEREMDRIDQKVCEDEYKL